MAVTIKFWANTTAGVAPSTSNISNGEIAVNTADKYMYWRRSDGVIVRVCGVPGPTGPNGPPGPPGTAPPVSPPPPVPGIGA